MRRPIGWEEALSVPFAFALYYVGFALLGRGVGASVGSLGMVGLVLFVIGSAVNTISEVFRDGPMLDRHLGEKYGEPFREYAARTAKIIPFVY